MTGRSRTQRKTEAVGVVLTTPIRVRGIEVGKLTVRDLTEEGYADLEAKLIDPKSLRLRDIQHLVAAYTGISLEEAAFLTPKDADRIQRSLKRLKPRDE